MLMQLMRHMEWANARVVAAFRAADRPDPLLIELFAHLLAAEHVWHARLVGDRPVHQVWPNLSLDQCAELAAENHQRLAAVVSSLGSDGDRRVVSYTNSAGQSFSSTVGEILAHVALHGSYHRGQIAWQLRADGHVPESTDFIAFARGTPAASRQGEPGR